tara:strand:+ start:119 stop:1294 length:1176 start_codon:yes stop_codon:yes gene_type:complete
MRCRIAFDTDPFATTPTWTDIDSDLLFFSMKKGRKHQLDRMEAATAVLILNNADSNYWPNNTGGDYSPNVLPAKRVNIRASFNFITYDVFTGFIESWVPSWRGGTGSTAGPIMTVKCAGVTKNLSRLWLNNAGESQELSGTRVGNVLDELSWPAADRDLDAGQSTLIATGSQVNVNSLAHLQTVQTTEQGIIFQAGDGDVQFQDRHARFKSPFTVSQATFGDDGGENKYFDIELSLDDETIFNDVRITRSGGTEQVASDATSQGDFGKRSLVRTALLMTSDNEALDQANYILTNNKDPILRAKSIDIKPRRDPDNLWPFIFTFDISTRITVRLNQASIDKDYHIEGITHTYDAGVRDWTTRWQLSDADTVSYWLLGTAGFGEIGQTTILGY